MLNLKAVGHRVLIKVKKFEEISEGGIITAVGEDLETLKYSQDEGEVVSIGPQAWKEFGDGSAWCKTGDTVFVNRHSGVFKRDEETKDIYRMVNDQDILGIVGG